MLEILHNTQTGPVMPRFSANLGFLFTELDFLDRFEAAARAGFTAVEYQSPYEWEPGDIAERLEKFNLRQVLFNLPSGDWAGGERGIACLPGRIEEFRDGVGKALHYAKALNCDRVNCIAGIRPRDITPALADEVLLANMKFAAKAFEAGGITLLLEPINTRDIPGFFVNRLDHALHLIKACDRPNVKLQYDFYHMQIVEGDIARNAENNLDVIGHIQIADVPGRHEPGTGEINYGFVLGLLDQINYTGWVGLEYRPRTSTLDGLDWLVAYR